MQLPNSSSQVDSQNVDLQKQIAALLRQNKSLSMENEMLNKRFGLVWPDQPEFFIKVTSDTEVVYQNGLYKRVGKLESNGNKATLLFDSSQESEELKRGDSAYLYSGKVSGINYLGNGGVAYEWKSFTNETYLPTLIKKGEGFGFNDKNGKRSNLLIEGDNYHALQVLQHTHRGAIDVIYIDPPYNTGNKDFKYNDKFVSDEDGCKHSSWLSFMERRLLLARSLLSNNGVVFIHIDNNELNRLMLLCESIFPFYQTLITIQVKAPSGDSSKSKSMLEDVNEYILCFSMSEHINHIKPKQVKEVVDENSKTAQQYNMLVSDFGERTDEYFDFEVGHGKSKKTIRAYKLKNFTYKTIPKKERSRGVYVEKLNSICRTATFSGAFEKAFKDKKEDVYEFDYVTERGDRKGVKQVLRVVNGNQLIYLKDYVDTRIVNNNKAIIKTEKATNNITDISWQGISPEGGVEFKNGKKPIKLLTTLLSWLNCKNGVVLDFFAGSGTTGHAAWELNKEDGGNRQVILVTNNESNICEGVTYERLRRCNLPEHGNYQQGLEYLQLKHVAETEVDGYDMAQSFEHIKQVINVRFGSFSVIEETDDWYITDKIAVLKNYVKYPAFFEKYGSHPAYGMVTKKERQSQVFRAEALKYATIGNIHVFNKEYLNDLYKVVREDI